MADAWTPVEVVATVSDYLDMLRDEVAGRAYSKAEHRAILRPRLAKRTDAAIEFKHQNISAVLFELGLRWIIGYRPAMNYQRSLVDEIQRQLGSDLDLLREITPPKPAEAIFEALAGNRSIEDAAINWVVRLEHGAGRIAIDRRFERAFPADLESPPRVIELKASATSYRGWFLPMEPVQIEHAKSDANFYIYVVENVGQGHPGKFTLKVLSGDRLRAMVTKATARVSYEVPWPVAEYDSAPGLDG